MISIKEIFYKIRRKWTKICLRPIRVFCFHHVTDQFDTSCMWEEDWTQIVRFKDFILNIKQQGYTFISLVEAHEKLKNDNCRRKKYAVLTADDGFRTLLNILPWLEEQQMPVTLFVNPKYILEDAIGENIQKRLEQTKSTKASDNLYLKMADIRNIQSSYISFAYHGYEHLDEWEMDVETFERNVDVCVKAMRNFSNVIPYYAHTYGHTQHGNDKILQKYGLTPVYVSGNGNYNNASNIDRELISNERLLKGYCK